MVESLTRSAEAGFADQFVHERTGEFRVRTEAYTSQEVFDLEMKQIFERSWVYVGHESELDHDGAYKTAYVGRQPVIVTRDSNGELHVMVNRCLHRASVVCRELSGTANLFRCPYHGWVYKNDGTLTGVPMRSGPSGYGEGFQQPEGLLQLPRVESYRGLIFASFDPDVQELTSFLGRAKTAIDRKLDESPVGRIRVHKQPFVSRYKGNWKFQTENIVDGYHFTFVHEAFLKLQAKYGQSTGDFGAHRGKTGSEERKVRASGYNWGTAQGHGLTARPQHDLEPFFDSEFGDYYRQIADLRGEEETGWLLGANAAAIFPNFGFIHHHLRVWRPISPDETEVWVYFYDLEDAPDEMNARWTRSQERFYGPSGHGQPDDAELFALNQQGLQGSAVEWLILERGIEAEQLLDDGDYECASASETNQRAFWRRWREMMNDGE